MRKLLALLVLFVLLSPSCFGAFTYLTSGSMGNSSRTDITLDTTSVDLIVLVYFYDAGSSYPPSITDAVHVNTGCYTLAKQQNGTGSSRVAIFYCHPTSVGTGHIITVQASNGYFSTGIAVYNGSKPGPPVDLTAGAAATGTSIQSGSITPNCTNDLIVTGIAGSGALVVSGVAGATSRQTVPGNASWHGGGLADSIQSSIAAFNPTWSISSASEPLASISVAFLAAASSCITSSSIKHRVISQ